MIDRDVQNSVVELNSSEQLFLCTRKISTVAKDEQLEQSLQSVMLTTEPKSPIVANSALASRH